METGRWNGHIFEVSPDVIRGFTGLSVKASCETEEQETDGQKYVTRKAANPLEATFTVQLNAYLGCDVREEAMAFLTDAQNGAQDYFYVGDRKLCACQLMLTDASTEDKDIAPGGTWTRCGVKLTVKQCTKNDGTVGGTEGGGGGNGGTNGGGAANKASVKTTPITRTGFLGLKTASGASGAAAQAESVFDKAKAAISASVAAVNAAKAASAKALTVNKGSTKKLTTRTR